MNDNGRACTDAKMMNGAVGHLLVALTESYNIHYMAYTWENNSGFPLIITFIGYKKNRMNIYIPIIISIIFCMAYCLCINLVNIYKPIAHMDISIGILFRLSVIIMFLTLLMGMLTVRFAKRKYLTVIPIIMPILLWGFYVKLFPYRSFVYMGISALIYLIHISILWYYNNKAKYIR